MPQWTELRTKLLRQPAGCDTGGARTLLPLESLGRGSGGGAGLRSAPAARAPTLPVADGHRSRARPRDSTAGRIRARERQHAFFSRGRSAPRKTSGLFAPRRGRTNAARPRGARRGDSVSGRELRQGKRTSWCRFVGQTVAVSGQLPVQPTRWRRAVTVSPPGAPKSTHPSPHVSPFP